MLALVLSFPPFRLDVADERLWKDGTEIKLRRKPFAILKYLAMRPRRLVTQEELVEAVWGKVAMSESLLRTHVRAVRVALGDDTLIETVTRRGYRFLSDVRELHEEPMRAAAPDPARDVTPALVGRSDELGVLRAHLEAALQGRRRMVFVTGDPGIGKTALVEALLREAAFGGALIARGTCIEQYGSGEAYLPVLGALGPICRGPRGARVVEVLGRHAPTWLTQMPGVAADDELAGLQLRVQGATRARMLRELADALEILSAEVPLVLALDDLQWSDNSTTELLAMLGRRREPARLLIVGTCRLTELARTDALRKVVGELSAHRHAATLALGLLATEAVGKYMSVRWPEHGFPSLARTIHEATSGNPLFMVALLDDLESRQMIRAVDGAWQLFATESDIRSHQPDSVRQLIDIQIDRLTLSDQRILEAAGAAGAEFTCGAVAHALELPVDDVESCCEGFAEQGRFLRYVGTETWPDGTLQARYAAARLHRMLLAEGFTIGVTTVSAANIRWIASVLRPFGHLSVVDVAASLDVSPLGTKSASLHTEMVFSRVLHGSDVGRQGQILETVAALVAEGRLRPIATTRLEGLTIETMQAAPTRSSNRDGPSAKW